MNGNGEDKVYIKMLVQAPVQIRCKCGRLLMKVDRVTGDVEQEIKCDRCKRVVGVLLIQRKIS